MKVSTCTSTYIRGQSLSCTLSFKSHIYRTCVQIRNTRGNNNTNDSDNSTNSSGSGSDNLDIKCTPCTTLGGVQRMYVRAFISTLLHFTVL